MCGLVQGCVLSDFVFLLVNMQVLNLPVLDRILHLIKALHSFIERVAGFDIGYENLPQQIKVLQIQRLAISRYDILDGQNIEWVNVRHDGRRFNSQSMDGEVF